MMQFWYGLSIMTLSLSGTTGQWKHMGLLKRKLSGMFLERIPSQGHPQQIRRVLVEAHVPIDLRVVHNRSWCLSKRSCWEDMGILRIRDSRWEGIGCTDSRGISVDEIIPLPHPKAYFLKVIASKCIQVTSCPIELCFQYKIFGNW